MSDAPATPTGDADRDTDTDERALVDVRNVSLSYGDLTVLEGVSLSVGRGEFVGLVGPNGAGKTTLLGAINGVADPDEGAVRVDGDAVASLSARETSRRVATVPQDTTVAFDFSVDDVVEMGRTPYHGRISGDPDAGAAVERALERTETAQFRDRAVGSLSGGERQRVVLARALAQETPALVLDEPTASLDINHQVRTLGLVRELTREADKGAIAAIHDLDLAARFCDRLAVLADGDLLAVGAPPAVLTDDHLRTAFDTAAAVLPDPVTGTPSVTPIREPAATDDAGAPELRVHVAGTGRVAARTIAVLSEAGVTVTAGVFAAGDVAAATARELGVVSVTAPPFSPLGAEREAAVRDLLADADGVVLAGQCPPAVRAILRDVDPIVRVKAPNGVGRDADSAVDSVDADDAVDPQATATPETVVAAVDRALQSRVEADD